MNTLFNYQAPVVAALETIEGLQVKTAIDDSELESLSAADPVAVVRWNADQVIQANGTAALVEREIAVHLLFLGATPESEAEDGEMALKVFQALHGLEMAGHSAPLTYLAGGSDYSGGVREYLLTFKTQTTLKNPGRIS